MLTDRLMILLHGNAVSAKAWANSLQILERVANDCVGTLKTRYPHVQVPGQDRR
jgi:hypothetical protein